MERCQGFAEQGNTLVLWHGLHSQNVVQGSFPFATVTVYNSGTIQLATIYHDNHVPPTPLSNPFTADMFGYWWFYARDGRYDVTMQGGTENLLAWTKADILLFDPFAFSADLNANGHCILNLGCLTFENPNCPAPLTINMNASCQLEIQGPVKIDGELDVTGCVNASCLNISGAANIQGMLLAGEVTTRCVHYSNNGPSLSLCADSSGKLHILNSSGADIGSMDQTGRLQVETLGVNGNIDTIGNVIANSFYGTGSVNMQGCVNAACLNISGNANIKGSVETPCVQWADELGDPAMWMCIDAAGVLHIRNTTGTDLGWITQAGQLEWRGNANIEGTLTSTFYQTVAGTTLLPGQNAIFNAFAPDGFWYQYTYNNGILTAVANTPTRPPVISDQQVQVWPGFHQYRFFDTVYQNTTGRPMFVNIAVNLAPGDDCTCFADSANPPGAPVATIASVSDAFTLIMMMSFWVLPGWYYSCNVQTVGAFPPVINTWVEWT